MPKANRAVAVIPSAYFRWRARVQYIKSFRKRAEALKYARQHGHNLVVESDEGNGPQFDVLQDFSLTGRVCVSFQLVGAENALI